MDFPPLSPEAGPDNSHNLMMSYCESDGENSPAKQSEKEIPLFGVAAVLHVGMKNTIRVTGSLN